MTRPADEPMSPADALRAADPVMAWLIDGLEPIDIEAWRTHWTLGQFGAIARAIVGQQIAGPRHAIFGRLQALIGDRDPPAP